MSRPLLQSSAFVRAAKRIARRDPGVVQDIEDALGLLSKDAFQPPLRTHKLSGKLSGSWA